MGRALEAESETILQRLFQENSTRILHLGDARRALYNDLHAVARHEEAGLLDIPPTIAAGVPAEGLQAADHLFVDMEGQFPVRLNEWEQSVLDAERARADFVTWIRNFDRKSWALAFPYSHGGQKLPGYPDFITVTGTPEAPVFNILEPHCGEDSVAKAKALLNSPTATARRSGG